MADIARPLVDRVEAVAIQMKLQNFRRSKLWSGADIVIALELPEPTEDRFYPDPRYVVTPYASELSWLFFQLKDAFQGYLNYISKDEFYGRLADAATRYGVDTPQDEQSAFGLLEFVLIEARVLARELGAADCCCPNTS